MSEDMLIKDLIPYLPHRPPMVWVNRVAEVGKDYKGLAGVCVVDIKKDSLYVNDGHELRASSAIEFTAQGFGYLKAAYQVIHKFNDPPSQTYLTGVRFCRANFESVDLDKVSQLEVSIRVIRELLPVTYVRGEVRVPGDETLLAETEIQVYFE
jgi:predicted hotdog family 3-hydroxylacyl-ACP dehydratase